MEVVNTAGAGQEQQPVTPGAQNAAGQQAAVINPNPAITPQANAGKQSGEPTQAQLDTWDKDKRFETMWKKDPNNMYKSYREIEKMYEPVKKEADDLKRIFAEAKIEPAQIKDILSELDTLKAPDRPQNALFSALEPYLKDPVYAKEIEAFFEEIERKSITAKYPGMNEEQIRKQIDLETRLNQLEDEKKKVEYEKQVETYGKSMGEAWTKIESFAKSRNFVLTDDIKKSFKDYCGSKMIDPELYTGVFQQLFNDEIEKTYSAVVEKQILEKLNKNKQTVVPAAGASLPAGQKVSFKDKLKAAAGIT